MEYQLAVKTAEEAVASMKDAKLREIAFAQILARLLGGEKQTPSRSAPPEQKLATNDGAPRTGKKQSGVTAWLRDLVDEGFLKTPRSMKAILQGLEEHGHHLSAPDITKQLQLLCRSKELRRKKLAPAEGKASIWHYSNW